MQGKVRMSRHKKRERKKEKGLYFVCMIERERMRERAGKHN